MYCSIKRRIELYSKQTGSQKTTTAKQKCYKTCGKLSGKKRNGTKRRTYNVAGKGNQKYRK